MLVYVSGRYSGKDHAEITANIESARKIAIVLWESGHAVICPHLNTAHFEVDCQATYDQYIAGDLTMVARCDAMVMCPGWETSKGANAERDYAIALGIPVYETEMPGLHPTEVRCPQQTKAFAEITGKMYRVHLSKNSDYSPANVMATGEVGLVTRLWDKTARLLNLIGFRFAITQAGTYALPHDPQHESIEDTYLDLAVYAIIGLLVRSNRWGR